MKFLVVLSVALAVAIAAPNYEYDGDITVHGGGYDNYGSGSVSGYGSDGYVGPYEHQSFGGYEGYDSGFGVFRKKRSVAYGVVPNVAYSSLLAQPAVSTVYSPSVYSPSVYSPLVKSAVVSPYYQSAPLYGASSVYVGGSAVSHQSQVQVKSTPAVVSQQVVQPVVSQTYVQSPAVFQSAPAVVAARSLYAPSYYAHQPTVVGVQTPTVVGVHSPTVVETPAFLTEEFLLKKKRETEKKEE